MPDDGSEPTTSASVDDPSGRRTLSGAVPSTTLALVRTIPSSRTTTPGAAALRGRRRPVPPAGGCCWRPDRRPAERTRPCRGPHARPRGDRRSAPPDRTPSPQRRRGRHRRCRPPPRHPMDVRSADHGRWLPHRSVLAPTGGATADRRGAAADGTGRIRFGVVVEGHGAEDNSGWTPRDRAHRSGPAYHEHDGEAEHRGRASRARPTRG